MGKYFLVLSALVVSIAGQSFATDEAPRFVGLSTPASGAGAWVEISVPFSKNGGFGDTGTDQKTSSLGTLELTVGWQPLTKLMNNDDGTIMSILKSVGLSVDGTVATGAKFGTYLYSVDSYVGSATVQPGESSPCFDYNGYWNGQCYSCPTDPYSLCQAIPVYGRDAAIKYEEGSIALGAYIPLEVAQKIQVAAGLNARLHFFKEGIQTDGLASSNAMSLDATIRVTYNMTQSWGANASYEQSVAGFDYKSFSVGVTYRF